MANSTNNSSNATNDCNYESAIPPSLQFAFGVLGNGIALLVLKLSSKTHKWRPFYRLVAALALTDGGGILLVYPSVMIRYAVPCFKMSPALCDYSSFIFTFTLLASAMIICGMSVDRFFAIKYPILYNTNTKYRRVNIMLGVIWITAAVICSLHLYGLGDSHPFYPKSWCFIDFSDITGDVTAKLNRANSFLYSLIGLIIIALTVSLNSTVVFTICRKRLLQNQSNVQRNYSQRDIFNILFLLTIVVVFTSCWTPLIIVIFAHAALWMDGDGTTELLVLRLAVTNSIIDPWIYILLRKETISALRRVLYHTVCCKLSYGMNSSSLDIPRERSCSVTSYRRSDGSQGKSLWLTDQESACRTSEEITVRSSYDEKPV